MIGNGCKSFSFNPGELGTKLLENSYIENFSARMKLKSPDDDYFEAKKDARNQLIANSFNNIGIAIEKLADSIASSKPPVNITINVYDSTDPAAVRDKIKEIINGL